VELGRVEYRCRVPSDPLQPAPDPQRAPPDAPRVRLTLGPSKRLTHAREFDAVYAAKMRKSAGGVSVSSCPNTLGRHRLGLAISRSVGTAAQRTRFKRLIREAFRLHQRELPVLPSHGGGGADGGCLDWVVSLRAGTAKASDRVRTRDQMARVLLELANESVAAWSRRARRNPPPQ